MSETTQRTTTEVLEGIDLTGRVVVITGASTGIGLETARALGAAGASVLITARDAAKGDAAVARLRELVPSGRFEFEVLELGSLASVRAATDAIAARLDHIDVLVANAGIMAVPFGRTDDGFELQLGTNHLGHFVFIGRLLPLLRAGAPSRVVLLSSAGHSMSDIVWADPNFEHAEYSKMGAYGQSKTANILHAVELERRLAADGVHAYAVHPGMVATELGRHFTPDVFTELADRAAAAATPKPGETTDTTADAKQKGGGLPPLVGTDIGAATSVWAATAPELEGRGGLYLADCVEARPARYASDTAAAERLWTLSEQLVGEKFV